MGATRALPAFGLVAAAVAIVLLLTGSDPAPDTSARGIRLGFADSVYAAPPATRDAWLERTVRLGADLVGIQASWERIAPREPAEPEDPASAGYEFSALDGAITAASARGLDVVVQINRAPRWAEAPGREPSAPPGTWRPSPRKLAGFATALARRYSGAYAPPGSSPLPPVRAWQVWGEPNVPANLSPQWREREGSFVPVAPGHYRRMLNAAYASVKAVQPDNFVVTAGTAPYGDAEKGGERIAPALFWRRVFCLDRSLRPACEAEASLDALAHDPYSVGGPRRRAFNEDDVSIADMGKLAGILEAAQRAGATRPPGGQEVWVTEVSWDSEPPDPDGIGEGTHARWLADALYLLWRAGVRTVLWFQVRDAAPIPSFASTFQSGVYLRDGRAKRAAEAFRFPFVAEAPGPGDRVTVWGRAPSAGEVTIERRASTGFVPIAELGTGTDDVFRGIVESAPSDLLRATIDGESSPTRRVPPAR